MPDISLITDSRSSLLSRVCTPTTLVSVLGVTSLVLGILMLPGGPIALPLGVGVTLSSVGAATVIGDLIYVCIRHSKANRVVTTSPGEFGHESSDTLQVHSSSNMCNEEPEADLFSGSLQPAPDGHYAHFNVPSDDDTLSNSSSRCGTDDRESLQPSNALDSLTRDNLLVNWLNNMDALGPPTEEPFCRLSLPSIKNDYDTPKPGIHSLGGGISFSFVPPVRTKNFWEGIWESETTPNVIFFCGSLKSSFFGPRIEKLPSSGSYKKCTFWPSKDLPDIRCVQIIMSENLGLKTEELTEISENYLREKSSHNCIIPCYCLPVLTRETLLRVATLFRESRPCFVTDNAVCLTEMSDLILTYCLAHLASLPGNHSLCLDPIAESIEAYLPRFSNSIPWLVKQLNLVPPHLRPLTFQSLMLSTTDGPFCRLLNEKGLRENLSRISCAEAYDKQPAATRLRCRVPPWSDRLRTPGIGPYETNVYLGNDRFSRPYYFETCIVNAENRPTSNPFHPGYYCSRSKRVYGRYEVRQEIIEQEIDVIVQIGPNYTSPPWCVYEGEMNFYIENQEVTLIHFKEEPTSEEQVELKKRTKGKNTLILRTGEEAPIVDASVLPTGHVIVEQKIDVIVQIGPNYTSPPWWEHEGEMNFYIETQEVTLIHLKEEPTSEEQVELKKRTKGKNTLILRTGEEAPIVDASVLPTGHILAPFPIGRRELPNRFSTEKDFCQMVTEVKPRAAVLVGPHPEVPGLEGIPTHEINNPYDLDLVMTLLDDIQTTSEGRPLLVLSESGSQGAGFIVMADIIHQIYQHRRTVGKNWALHLPLLHRWIRLPPYGRMAAIQGVKELELLQDLIETLGKEDHVIPAPSLDMPMRPHTAPSSRSSSPRPTGRCFIDDQVLSAPPSYSTSPTQTFERFDQPASVPPSRSPSPMPTRKPSATAIGEGSILPSSPLPTSPMPHHFRSIEDLFERFANPLSRSSSPTSNRPRSRGNPGELPRFVNSPPSYLSHVTEDHESDG